MFSSNNWPRATALAVIMIALIVVPLAMYNRAINARDGEAVR
jgi:putrescine transport system permease protein